MAKRRAVKPIPEFGSEAEERAFWERHDTADYVDWNQARAGVFPTSSHPRRRSRYGCPRASSPS